MPMMGTCALTRLVNTCKKDDMDTQERILICGSDNLEDLHSGVVLEASPAASLNPNSSSIELFLEQPSQSRARLHP